MLALSVLKLLGLALLAWVAAILVATWVEALRSGVAPLLGPYLRIRRTTNRAAYWFAVLLLLIPTTLGVLALWPVSQTALPLQWIPPAPAKGYAPAGVEPIGPSSYFPKSLTRKTYTCDSRRRSDPLLQPLMAARYSRHLAAAGEPSLLPSRGSKRDAGDAFRFIWLRSFDRPVIVRVQDLEGGALLITATRLSGMGGEEPGGIETRVERMLSPSEARRFEQALAAANRLKLPAVDCYRGYDGARWIFEGRDAGAYRFVDRWSPEEGNVRELGLVMLDLAGWGSEKVY
jgi:hypothetical protein